MNNMSEEIRVLIVDDIPQVRQGLRTMLKLAAKNMKPKLEVIGEAQNGREAITQTQALQPDVVLMDLEMPLLDGYEVTRWIKVNQPETRVIILSIHAGCEEQERAYSAGADGFVIKGCSYKVLLNAILPNEVMIEKE
jgi:DNA-binding NarL/FixJ family response regulator